MGLRKKRLRVVLGALLLASAAPGLARALQVEQLDARDWHVKSVAIEGNEFFGDSALLAKVQTQPRPWYTPWRARPVFDPLTLAKDLERLRRFYEQEGFFEAKVVYHLEASEVGSGDLVDLVFWIEEGPFSTVSRVEVGVRGEEALPLPESLPVKEGARFDEGSYKKGESELKHFFLDHGRPHVDVERSAEVDAANRRVAVAYVVTPGPEGVFGETTVSGNEKIPTDLILQDVEWQPGERFSLSPIEQTRSQLLKRDLFASVRTGWRSDGKPWQVPMIIEVGEKPHRQIKLGVGTATDERYRVQAAWTNNNFFGGARQMTFTVKYGEIQSSIGALFRQPHFLTRKTDGVVEFKQDRDDEVNYVLWASRLHPRLEHRFTGELTGALGWRLEVNKFKDVDEATEIAIGGVEEELLRSGPSATLVWNTTDVPLEPRDGGVVTTAFDSAGIGGDYAFWKFSIEGKKYTEIGWDLVLANRVQVAFADALGEIANLPLSERLYSGGQQSVRGYARRRLGPRSSEDDPIGGRSRIEGSAELRRPIWGALGGAVFLDAGGVSVEQWDVPVDELEWGTGFAVTYSTPVGPLRLDVGFPIDPIGDDSWFQIYFSIGQFY